MFDPMDLRRIVGSVLAILIAAIVSHGFARAEPKRIETAHFVIEYEGIPDYVVPFVVRDADRAFEEVTGFLGKRFSRKIRIEISDQYAQPVSSAKDATSRIPANRLMPAGAQVGQEQIRGRGVTFWAAVAQVVAPSGQRPEERARFLTDGLGVYLQWKFGGKAPTPWPADVYPNMGEDIHPATAKLAAQIGFLSLDDAVRELNDRRLTRARQLGWLEAASLVECLIETGPLASFEKWYDGAPFKAAYGIDLTVAEANWKTYIVGIK